MPTIYLIRHGENDYVKTGRLAGRLPGVHLNETGRQQAQAVADALSQSLPKEQVKAIYSSPLERAIETAAPVAQAFELETVIREGLIETHYGEWQDKSVKGLSRLKVWKHVQSAPSLFSFPGGESFADAQNRVVAELKYLHSNYEAKDIILCVSHADPIKLAVAYFIGLPLDLFQRLQVAPASINALFIDHGVSRLLTLNFDLSLIAPLHSHGSGAK
jgi:probable phosphomutase (TIGR03848 family)